MYSMKNKYFKPLDLVFFLISLFFVLLSVFLIGKQSNKKSYIHISSPKAEYIYPLDTSATYTIEGSTGNTIIEVKNNQVTIIDSPCPNKNCVSKGYISKNGQWNACLPNEIFIRIESKDNDDIDAISQ